MIAKVKAVSDATEALRRQFVEQILPLVQRHASVQLRYLNGQDREDAIAEAVAFAWHACVCLAERGKDFTMFPSRIADFAVRRVRGGRCFGRQSERDIFSMKAQQRHDFSMHRFDDESCDPETGWKEAVLVDSRTSSVPDIVAFRLDFGSWLCGLSNRNRRIAERLLTGERPGEVAQRFRLSPHRISRLRKEFRESWEEFESEESLDVAAA